VRRAWSSCLLRAFCAGSLRWARWRIFASALSFASRKRLKARSQHQAAQLCPSSSACGVCVRVRERARERGSAEKKPGSKGAGERKGGEAEGQGNTNAGAGYERVGGRRPTDETTNLTTNNRARPRTRGGGGGGRFIQSWRRRRKLRRRRRRKVYSKLTQEEEEEEEEVVVVVVEEEEEEEGVLFKAVAACADRQLIAPAPTGLVDGLHTAKQRRAVEQGFHSPARNSAETLYSTG